MAVRSEKKFTTVLPSSLGNVGFKNDNSGLKRAALLKVDIKGNIDFETPEAVFKLNPTTFEEDKSANWVQHTVPGQSDPVFQWVSSGPRTVTFEALVTTDTSHYNSEESTTITKKSNPKSPTDIIGQIASKFFKVSTPPARTVQTPKNIDTLDISDTLNYYRSLLYPEYSGNGTSPSRLESSPPLLVLMMGSSLAKIPYEKRITNKHDVWVLSNLRIRVTKQLQNLAPMEAVVQFTLVQYNIRSFSGSRFKTNYK